MMMLGDKLDIGGMQKGCGSRQDIVLFLLGYSSTARYRSGRTTGGRPVPARQATESNIGLARMAFPWRKEFILWRSVQIAGAFHH